MSNILYKVAHTNFSIVSFLSHFFKKYCMSDASRCWQEGFIQLFYSSLWKNFNQSFFKNYCKTTHRFGQTSQGTPWILFISLRNETFRKSRCLYSFFVTKKLTPMAAMYQVRYPPVSGASADWRNLELSPLPLSKAWTFSSSGGTISHRSYATELLKGGYNCVYTRKHTFKI